MYSWAVKVGEVPEDFNNPARGISRFKINSRERFLSVDELARLGDALREAETIGLHDKDGIRRIMSPHVVAAVRLLLFTGCRIREILDLRHESVDLERGVLALPDSKTGRKIVVLPAPAMEVLATLPRLGAYVIAGAHPDRPRSDLNGAVACHHRTGEPCRCQAPRFATSVRLRRRCRQFPALPVIGRLLGHRKSETTAKYAHFADDPLRRAANAIASTIAASLGENREVGADIVSLRPKR